MDSTADLFATSMLSVHDAILKTERTPLDEENPSHLHDYHEEDEDDDHRTEHGGSNEHIAAPLLEKKEKKKILRPPSEILKSAGWGKTDGGEEMKSMKDIPLRSSEDLLSSSSPPQTKFQTFVQTNLGILYMILSAFLFCFVSLAVKAIAMGNEKIPTTEVVFVRSVVSLICCYGAQVYWNIGGGFVGWKIEGIRGLLFLRGVGGFAGMLCGWQALSVLSLGDATVIGFLSPVFTAIMATFFLKEPYELLDAVTGFLSLLGVTFIARPPFLFGWMNKSETPVEALSPDTIDLIDTILSPNITDPNNITADIIPPSADASSARFMGVIAALIGAVLSSMTYILVRKLGTRASAVHITGFFSLVSIPLSLLFSFLSTMSTRASAAPPNPWIIPQDPLTYLYLLIVAFAALGGQLTMNKSLQLEKAGRAASVNYVQVVFAFLAEWVVWGTTPHALSVVGSLIVGSCVVLIAVSKMRKGGKK
ncbi:hypothetical protein HK097_004713 [Rhizophlyctis rosea]|uniref:EamA domain-containing protein n=1 Tax=Rhizophlyctis rosea TaxID=64517 RepID=A0AAD5S254_9FUNG|nr:hypothetical protein HK097_004713 [Rhizophlyctis rosea]